MGFKKPAGGIAITEDAGDSANIANVVGIIIAIITIIIITILDNNIYARPEMTPIISSINFGLAATMLPLMR